ncbi:MAG: hypothetical protein RLZZ383_1151, partial [Pseudomonadota bacterium]
MTERVQPADVWWPGIPTVEPEAERRLAHLPPRVALDGGALDGGPDVAAARRGALVKLLDVGRTVDLHVVAASAATSAEAVLAAVRECVAISVRFGDRVAVHATLAEVPADAAAAAAVAAGVFEQGLAPEVRIERLRGAWTEVGGADASLRLRRLDDLLRRVTFDMLEDAHLYRSSEFPGQPMRKHVAVERAVAVLGEPNRWKRQVRL